MPSHTIGSLVPVILLCGVALTGCVKAKKAPPEFDRNGRSPNDVVVLFLKAVQVRDYETAKKYWYGEYKPIMAGARMPTFQEYCDRFARVKQYTLRGPYAAEGDPEYRTVVFEGATESGERDGNLFALKIRDGEWKMNRSMSW
jgi:hypothetical protein